MIFRLNSEVTDLWLRNNHATLPPIFLLFRLDVPKCTRYYQLARQYLVFLVNLLFLVLLDHYFILC